MLGVVRGGYGWRFRGRENDPSRCFTSIHAPHFTKFKRKSESSFHFFSIPFQISSLASCICKHSIRPNGNTVRLGIRRNNNYKHATFDVPQLIREKNLKVVRR